MKAQKAKMKENKGPKGQNERKSRPKRPKWRIEAQKAKIRKMKPGLALLNSLYGTKAKRTVFGNLWGGPHGHPEGCRKEMKAQKAKMKGNKAQKAKMKGNEGLKGQNERKWKPKRPKWKEMKAQKAKMEGNESPKGQNERQGRPKRPWPPCASATTNWTTLRFNLRFGVSYSRATLVRLQRACPVSARGLDRPGTFARRTPRYSAALLRMQAYGCGLSCCTRDRTDLQFRV